MGRLQFQTAHRGSHLGRTMPVNSTLSGSDTLLGLHPVGVAHGYLIARFQRDEIGIRTVAESTVLVGKFRPVATSKRAPVSGAF